MLKLEDRTDHTHLSLVCSETNLMDLRALIGSLHQGQPGYGQLMQAASAGTQFSAMVTNAQSYGAGRGLLAQQTSGR
jgi:hypothetical protein